MADQDLLGRGNQSDARRDDDGALAKSTATKVEQVDVLGR